MHMAFRLYNVFCSDILFETTSLSDHPMTYLVIISRQAENLISFSGFVSFIDTF